ncbi:MAG: K(+) H(+) antiporter 1 [Lasallia pustulata]|uniref:K(+) H(+) antiporter 1 n=1 Tax=Lasallia pustulata TaxID=136370 RepID=A0A5M8Q052_9LECA|nr:MAG: K(+) H(+) antiporter 1 [Lasallia pustulata]
MSSSSIASVVTKVVTKTVTKASASATSTVRATPQGGVLEGGNPSVYDPKNPIILFIIQSHVVSRKRVKHNANILKRAGIIVIFCRLLHYPLSKLRQPRVIAEVIGGILLGPSVLMRIPGFQTAIFPAASMPNLTLVANLGLILFLFLIGLEVNMRMFVSNWRLALSVGLAGMILPFGLGCAIAWGLYQQFRHDAGTVPISFGVYMLFIGTALSITAFPVLCRILSELKLLGTSVGITVLAAGVGNDVTGWILLALCVALVNNGSGITALYVLLTAVGWVLFLVYAIRPAFLYLLRRSGSLDKGPSQAIMALTLLLALTSAWFTGIIGVHPIFGAFLVGLICPHDGGFARKVTDKIEDLVSVLLLPLYFALSGLNTNLGLLNDGITWAYVVGVIAIALSAKIIGGTLAARACNMLWRESFSIGVLMSCKGLVELIVLNIGLQAKILSTRTFTIFVVMALVTTVSTTPLTLALYPAEYQRKTEAWRRGEIDWSGNHLSSDASDSTPDRPLENGKLEGPQVRRLLVYLRLDSLPSLFTFIALLGGDATAQPAKPHRTKRELSTVSEAKDGAEGSSTALVSKRALEVHGLRMLELTERTSTVMQASEVDENWYRDPVVNAFRTFAQLNNVAVSGGISIVPESSYADTLTSKAIDHLSDLVLIPIPWDQHRSDLHLDSPASDAISSDMQEAFIQRTLDTATCNIAIFIDKGFGGTSVHPKESNVHRTVSGHSYKETVMPPIADRSHHVYFPFFGGVDDRVALRFVLQLAQNNNITATIIHFISPIQSPVQSSKVPHVTVESQKAPSASAKASASQVSIAGRIDTEALYQDAAKDSNLLYMLRDSLPAGLANRLAFVDVPTTTPVAACIEHMKEEIGRSPRNAGDLIVVGRGKKSRVGMTEMDLTSTEMRTTFGVVADEVIANDVKGSVLVIQAGEKGRES